MRARAWMISLAVLAGCGGGSSQPPPPSPPGVQVLPAHPVAVDTQFSVDVQVTGCTQLSSVSLTDQVSGEVLASEQNPSPRTTFTFQRNQVPYKEDGIAATLDLIANAKCSNGTSGQSNGVDQLFMPADTLFTGNFPFTTLSLDPDGTGLVTCSNRAIVDLGTDGTQRATSAGSSLPFDCTSGGRAIHDGRTVYWLEPNLVARLNSQLQPTGNPYFVSPGQVLLPADTSAPMVIFDASGGPALAIDRSTGNSVPLTLAGVLDGAAGLGNSGLYVPEESNDSSGTTVNLQVEHFNPTTGASSGVINVASVQVDQLGLANVPALNLSADGSQAYFISGANNDELWICPSDSSCVSGGTHVIVPGGPYVAAQPLGQNIVVVGPNAVLFTNLAGSPVGSAAHPSGGLSVLGVYPGTNSQFYMLDGDSGGNLLELVMFSAAGQEAARFAVAGTPFGADLDQNGVPYLLFGGQLAKLLTPDQYLAARQ